MSILMRLIGSSLFVFVFAILTFAQETRTPLETPPQPAVSAPLVTATVNAKRVRFVSPGTVVQLRLEVYNEAGQKLFDTELRGGNVLDWQLQDGAGQSLPEGSYACVLTIKSLSGRLSQRVGLVNLNDKKSASDPAQALQLSLAQQQTIGPMEGNGPLTFLYQSEADAITAVTHDGQDGQVTATTGALTFRTGDVFAGKDKEHMRITEDGRVGIGTHKPEATLDVVGTLRVSEGFNFPDGTTLRADNGKLLLTNSIGKTEPSNVSGTGTLNRLAKWNETGGAGTLTDAAISEAGGLTVFGVNSSGINAPLFPTAPNYHVVEIRATDAKTPLVLAGGASSIEFWNDASGDGTGSPVAAGSLGMGKPGTAATNDIVFSSYSTGGSWNERMRISNSGNVLIGGTLTAGALMGNGSALTNVPGTLQWQVVAGTSQQTQSNTGYLANSDSEVNFILPPTPNIGDTIRVTGAGTGGWRISPNSGQQILTPNFASSTWTGNQNWNSVASSSDGTKLVAVAGNLPIQISTDSGANWTPHESNRGWIAVASSSDGSKLVAAVNEGQIYTSTDSGANWTPRESNRPWSGVASSSDGSKLVATVAGGQIYTSTDSGAVWTPRDSDRSWRSVASSADGSKLVAAAAGGLPIAGWVGNVYTSIDSGVSWTPRETDRSWTAVASSSDGSKLVALDGQIYTSTDSGIGWTPRETNRQWSAVASSADGSKLVAVVTNGRIYTSIDSGVSWTPRESNRAWTSVASSADGSKLVAVVREGQIHASTDSGVTWSVIPPGTEPGYLTGGQLTAIELQYIGNGKFLPLSHEGSLVAH